MSSVLYKEIIDIINDYVDKIKLLKQINNNKINNNSNNNLQSSLNIFGVPWRADNIMQNRLNEFKKVSILLSQSCTKLAILIVKKLSNEIIDSLLVEIKKYIELLNLGYYELQHCLICDPLFDLIKLETISILVQIKEFINYISSGNLDNNINISAGMILERSDSIQKVPMSNKAAYRRSILEYISVTKDTVQEFETYIQSSIEQINNKKITNNDNNNEDNNEDNNENDDDFNFDEDVEYNSTEIIIVNKCILLIKSSLDCMKVALSLMTCVADNITNSKSQKEVAANIISDSITLNDLDKPLSEIQCDEWIGKIHQACKIMDSCALSLGGELYPPIEDEDINEKYISLLDALNSTNILLQEDVYKSLLTTEIVNMLENILNITTTLPLSIN